MLRAADVKFVGVGSHYAVPPGSVTKADGTAYRVFTPFSKAWRAVGWETPLDAPSVEWRGAPDIRCDGPPHVSEFPGAVPTGWAATASERGALDRWSEFLPQVGEYHDRRDLPAVDGTSRLSAALRWGVVHPRQLVHDLGPERGDTVFASELAWRDFYADVLFR